jgi:hypothetical protein
MKNRNYYHKQRFVGLIASAGLIALTASVNSQIAQKLPDCCVKAEKDGKICEGYPQSLKAGATTFKLGYISLFTKDIGRLYDFYRQIPNPE